ncbi:pyridoxamine 5'-phosphate oxidase family protein [Gammaproteobacteria bacterium]|nr:pyridoxamine 5'-phosphate oxidase family protein [Gammaproteobacteria bacterium]MDA9118112.1 pyridoxamine 5'-phosphate oxidase family protein [Gammaproteobacteria bacterium]
MIKFINIYREIPYLILKRTYNKAVRSNQSNVEAIAISSYDKEKNEVDSRFVNLKFVDGDRFIFFSNYKSPKSIAFESHNQISALLYWQSINVQIRMRANIKKMPINFNKQYFSQRSINKNALAISSNQSQIISSFDEVAKQYNSVKKKSDLKNCPKYWGGYSFTPYEIEFWTGDKNRLNKRNLYKKNTNGWDHYILEP